MFSHSCLLSFALLFGTACRVNGPVIGQTADGPVIGPTGSSRPTQEPVLASEVTLEVITKRAAASHQTSSPTRVSAPCSAAGGCGIRPVNRAAPTT